MRKITFILSLLLTFAGMTASAQNYAVQKVASIAGTNITKASDIVDGGYYAFKNVGRGWYMKTNVNNKQVVSGGNTFDVTAKGAGAMVFKLNKQTATVNDVTVDAYTFESVVTELADDGTTTKLYIPALSSLNCDAYVNATDAEKFQIIENANGNFNFKSITGGMYMDGDPYVLKGWNTTGDTGNGAYQLYPVTLTENAYDYSMLCSTTVKKIEGGTETTISENLNPLRLWDGETYTIPPTSYYFTTSHENTTVSKDNYIFVISKTGEAPVTFSTADSKTWYKLQINNSGERTLKSIAEDNTLHVYTHTGGGFNATDLGNYSDFNNAVWNFEEAGVGVKVYNKGTGKYLKWASGCAELVAETDATTFYITENTANNNAGFGLWTGSGNKYLNASDTYGGTVNARLGVWDNAGSKNDKGSCFIVEAIDLNADLLAVGKACLTATLNAITPNETIDNYVTAGLQTDIDKTKAAAEQATSIAELDATLLLLNMPTIDPNAIYRIFSAHGGFADTNNKYVSTKGMHVGTDGTLSNAYNQDHNMDRKVYRVPEAADFMSQLWQFEPNEDGKTYKVKSANAGAYWCNNPNDNIDMPIYKSSSGDIMLRAMPGVSFSDANAGTNDGKSMFQLVMDGHFINAYDGKSANYLKAWDQADDAGGYWRIEKVTTVPLTISAAGYASAGFPFAVQVPAESGVKAYYATSAGNGVMGLTAIEDGIIPANQGVVLAYEGTEALPEAGLSVTLTITTTENTISGNKLVAATAKRTGFASGDNYLLAKDSQDNNKVKFLLSDITTVPANKAYLPAANYTDGTASTALAFDFGNSTAISDVVKDSNEDIRYYDLNGRRVLFPSNGIFITNTGKKVLVK